MLVHCQEQNNQYATHRIIIIKVQEHKKFSNKINKIVTPLEFLILKLRIVNAYMEQFIIKPLINAFVQCKNLYGQEKIVYNVPSK